MHQKTQKNPRKNSQNFQNFQKSHKKITKNHLFEPKNSTKVSSSGILMTTRMALFKGHLWKEDDSPQKINKKNS